MALRASEMEQTFAEAVQVALVSLEWKPRSLFARYEIAGGKMSQSTIENYIAGVSRPQIDDYNILARVLNEALGEERFPELPFRSSPRGHQIASTAAGSDIPGSLSLKAA
jgi:hypothetical protein